jgi:hypothetical protein
MALKPEDFWNPAFSKQRVVKRKLPARAATPADDEGDDALYDGVFGFEREPRPRKKLEEAYEGTTFTDDYNEVGFTYYLSDGLLTVKNKSNVELFKGVIASAEDFEKALKKADIRLRRRK